MSYLKLHRKITDWEWYSDPNTFRLFLHLLLKANYKSNRWQGFDIMPGQLVSGRKILAQELKLSEQEIRTSLNKLKSTNEITIKSTNKFSIVTICKWDDYQTTNEDDQPAKKPAKHLTSNQQSTTLKEGIEIKNNISVIFDEFRKQYPGTKRGLNVELENFLKKNKPETVHLLLPSLQREILHRNKRLESNQFVAEWKNLSTWINKQCWTQEFPEINSTGTGKVKSLQTEFHLPEPKYKAI